MQEFVMTTQEVSGDRPFEKQRDGMRKEQAINEFAGFLGSHRKLDRQPHSAVLPSVLAISSRLTCSS